MQYRAGGTTGAADSAPAAQAPWAAVFAMTAVGVLNMMDRFLPAILAEPIKADLALSDVALGFINGVGFLLIYAVAGIPIARLSDTGRHGVVIGACVGLWSAMTALGGFAQAGWQLALSRMGVALGEAGSAPATHAFISQSFAPNRRAAALAVFTLSVPLGTMASFIGGALLGEYLGWRATFILMGAVGFLIAPIATYMLVQAKKRQMNPAQTAAAAAPSQADLGPLLKKRSVIFLLAAGAMVAFGGYSATAFGTAFLMRTHGLSVAEAGVQFGVLSGVAGAIALLATGWIADKLSARDPVWLLRVVAFMILAALPASAIALTTGDSTIAVACLSITYIIPIAYLAPTVAALHRLAPSNVRATASALLLFSSAVVGGLGPLAVGFLSDALNPDLGVGALGRALFVTPAAFILAAVFYFLAIKTFRAEINERQ